MTLWIRIDANIGDNPNVLKLAELRGVSAEEIVGLCVILFGKIAEHCPSGDVSDVSDATLERWASWRREPGTFAPDFRRLFVSDGVVEGWAKRQGALIERAEKEKERWHRRNTAKEAKKLRGVSAEESAARNGTLRSKEQLPPATAVGEAGSASPPGFPPEFEAVWAIYPKRSGGNSKKDAHAAWRARLRSGVPAAVLHAGVARYAAYLAAEGKVGSRFVMMAASFFGAGDHYLELWDAPDPALARANDRPRVLAATEMLLT